MARQLNEQFKKSGKIKVKMSNGKFYPITGERLSKLEEEGKLSAVLADAVLEITPEMAEDKAKAEAKAKADAEKAAKAEAKAKADAEKAAKAKAAAEK